MNAPESGTRWRGSTADHTAESPHGAKPIDGFALLGAYRPDVMQAVLALRPLLGESLEPKTKELIRIAVHVERGSRDGLRCAVPQALANGATPEQMIDTVLLLLPDIGLAAVTDGLSIVAEYLESGGG